MKYLILFLISLGFFGCGVEVKTNKIEGEAKIDHRIRYDLSNIENYFKHRCKKELKTELNREPTNEETNECVAFYMTDFLSVQYSPGSTNE